MKAISFSTFSHMLSCILVVLLLGFSVACGDKNSDNNTTSDTPSNNIHSESLSSTGLDTSSSANKEPYDPYTLHEVKDSRVTTTETQKTFNDSNIAISLSFPVEWNCLEINGEDGSSYFFQDPDLKENCQFSFSITGSVYFHETTKAEFLDSLSYSDRQNISITSFEKQKFKGINCTKAVYTYTLNGTEFTCIEYDNVVVDFRMYGFSINYPTLKSEACESIFESIINSVELTQAN